MWWIIRATTPSEVIDKRRGIGTLFRDEAAVRFKRRAMRDVAAATEMDDFENWIADYGSLLTSRPSITESLSLASPVAALT